MAIPFPEIDPNAFVIPVVNLPIRWYALAYIAGLLAGWRIIVALMNRPALWGGEAPMRPKLVEDLLTAVILGVVIGGRLGFVLFYEPGYYLTHPLEVVKVWQGGMSFHGGFLGTVVAGLWFCRRHELPALRVADAFALVAPIGLFLGRVANFIKPELWGRPTDAPWGVIFPVEAAQLCNGIAGQIDGICARHPSQLYEAGLEGLLLGALLWALMATGALKRPGLLLGVFLIGYGLSRAVVELFRQPDAQFVGPGNPLGLALQFGDWGLTMGQILSLPMIAVGLWFALRARRGQA
ncbi:prolipoprotein diacylglyceryl transferase [Sinirhodobacter huangdaonensis]|uniref:Phosphatidylglycerol--prolipoprotein diacylglyceryl transferase n=1 Tax=Paenirhodobacter huangdaonensis TaxID=2501515 RepID=A0A3S3LWW1_9RHOB|nr:prolipoprotein diacylglyceryl transferase [Sinirhodobacter huangdaonensis]RWR54824.1 prolipoprotein diacylglyceryl transferase [Sinirhodobacter huangdaonensis]